MGAETSRTCVNCGIEMKESMLMNHLKQCSRMSVSARMSDGTMHSATFHGHRHDLVQSALEITRSNNFLSITSNSAHYDPTTSGHLVASTGSNHFEPVNSGGSGGGAHHDPSPSGHRIPPGRIEMNESHDPGRGFGCGLLIGKWREKDVACEHCGTVLKESHAKAHSQNCMNLKFDHCQMKDGTNVTGIYQGSKATWLHSAFEHS